MKNLCVSNLRRILLSHRNRYGTRTGAARPAKPGQGNSVPVTADNFIRAELGRGLYRLSWRRVALARSTTTAN